MWTIREVIQESIYRANIVGRRQTIPDDKFEDALNILRDLASEFSNKNLLQWLRRTVELNHINAKEEAYILSDDYVEGENFWFIINGNTGVLPEANIENYNKGCEAWNKDRQVFHIVTYEPRPGATGYRWEPTNFDTKEEAIADLNGAIAQIIPAGVPDFVTVGMDDPTLIINGKPDQADVKAKNPSCITEVYYELERPEVNGDFNRPLLFVSYEDFWQGGWGPFTYTWQATSDTKLTLYLKKAMVDMINTRGFGLKILYNQAWNFDADSEVRAPDIYRSLFLSALTYRLAVRFPRLSEEHTQRLKNEMDDRINTLSVKTRANKYVSRQTGYANNLCTVDQLMAGSYLFPPG